MTLYTAEDFEKLLKRMETLEMKHQKIETLETKLTTLGYMWI